MLKSSGTTWTEYTHEARQVWSVSNFIEWGCICIGSGTVMILFWVCNHVFSSVVLHTKPGAVYMQAEIFLKSLLIIHCSLQIVKTNELFYKFAFMLETL